MTFLELEKECKKRRLLRIFKIIIFLLILGVVLGCFLLQKSQTTKEVFKNLKKETFLKKENNITNQDKNITKSKKILKKETVKKPFKEKLKLIIDLNISNSDKKPLMPSPKKSDVKKNKVVVKNETLLKTTTLPSFETCIKLSQNYYNEKNYKEALKWAKNANLQNNKNPESWIMSAKALYKLGKKEEALKILKIYYNYHKDEKVKLLLKELNESN
jgi:tetratricopeptide (TPR) repeat protein